eukprot:TRINITY_DN12835_c0_g11_i1.p1 TRINITY_DN12835_c0_g11~~TRINITY_DN12835_c0_g11_i1.p1  ORF type:complete len:250 (+),score=60.50 TRINITY_DN12835_c0_g11_i1:61-810(+)
MGNSPPSSPRGNSKRDHPPPVQYANTSAPVQGQVVAPPTYDDCVGTTTKLQKDGAWAPRRSIPNTSPVPYHEPRAGKFPEGILFVLGTDMRREQYLNPLSRGRCEVKASSVQVGMLGTLVEHEVGYFSTADDPSPWIQVSFQVGVSVYPDHYVLGGCDVGHRDDMMRSWMLEGSMDGSDWEVLRQHQNEECFVDADRFRGPKGWQCFSLPPRGPFRHFRVTHTGTTANGGHEMLVSAFEVFGHIHVEEE